MSENESTKPAGKGRPTPSRKTQEKANLRPLVGGSSPEERRAAKNAMKAERLKARAGMMAGDEKYLTARDRGPQKRFIRDFIDSKFSLGELVMPAMIMVILLSAIESYVVQLATLLTMWVLFIAVGINAWLTGRKAKRLLSAKYGESKLDSGIMMYATMRSIQMRALRMPKPQVKRGTKISA